MRVEPASNSDMRLGCDSGMTRIWRMEGVSEMVLDRAIKAAASDSDTGIRFDSDV